MLADPLDGQRLSPEAGPARSDGAGPARRLAIGLWPVVALVVLLSVTVQDAWARELSHVAGAVFIALLMGAAVAGWIVAWLVELALLPVGALGRPDRGPAIPGPGGRAVPRAVLGIVILAGFAGLLWSVTRVSSSAWHDSLRLLVTCAALLGAGAAGRLWLGSRHVVHQLVVGAAMSGWAYYDAGKVLGLPFRDLKLYLDAGGAWLDGRAVYLAAPLTTLPSDPSLLPYVYPPFLLPFFGALDRLPLFIVIVMWEIAAVAAVVLSLKLIGVRTRWLPVLMLWPPIALGLSVGNAAPFGFLGLAAGWRWGPALVLGGIFKAQAAIPALSLLRDRRWRPFVLGCAIVAGLIVVTLPLTGVAIYGDWLRGLQAFEATLRRYPAMQGFALQRGVPPTLALALAVVAAVAAAAASGRLGLSRLAVASIVASPSVYIHGLTFILPAALWLDTASLWLILGLVPTAVGAWLAIAVAGVALLFGLGRSVAEKPPGPLTSPPQSGAAPSLHLLAPGRAPWP